jgi:branched-chain amino acid transport system ATP-binding protein
MTSLTAAVGQPTSAANPVLRFANVSAGYGKATVLRDVSFEVPAGGIIALLGPNGAGKTTLLKTAIGLLRPTHGAVYLHGKDVKHAAPNRRSRQGLCLIPEGRGIFRGLSVRDNLRMHQPRGAGVSVAETVDRAVAAFPILGERLGQLAGTMSGGQQQMLALARAFVASPRVVLLDEVSMGLAPKVVDEIFAAIARLAAGGTALVLVEQYVTRALELADSVVLLDRGSIAYDGPASGLEADAVLRGYLGVDLDSTPNPSSTEDGTSEISHGDASSGTAGVSQRHRDPMTSTVTRR